MLGLNKKIPPYAFMLLIVFLVPMLISWCLYYFHEDFQFKTINHGILIKPVIPTEPLSINEKHVWQIVYAPKECAGEIYEKTTSSLHQLLLALGENQTRVRSSFLVGSLCQPKDAQHCQTLTPNAQQVMLVQKALLSSDIPTRM